MCWACARRGAASRTRLWAGLGSLGCGYKEGRGAEDGGDWGERRVFYLRRQVKGSISRLGYTEGVRLRFE